MDLSASLNLAFSTIWAHKLRSFLTLLGMIIGITAFVVILSLLEGFSSYLDENIAKVGSNAFTVEKFGLDDYKNGSIVNALRRNKDLTMEELEYVKDRAQLIDKIGAKAGGITADIQHEGRTIYGISVSGTDPVIAEIDNLEIAEGRYFTDSENNNSIRVAYIGADIAKQLFPNGQVLDKELSIHGLNYRVIGIQVAQGTIFGKNFDSFVQLPIKTFGKDFGGLANQHAPIFEVTPKSDGLLNDAVEEVRTLMRVERKIPFNEKDSFGIITPDAIQGLKNRVLRPMFIIVLAVPGIAMIVGGIGIMNIMLVSVTERTKEIGIRKALGARHRDILRQFLFESLTLSTVGGLTGLILAKLLGYLVTAYVFQTQIPLWSVFLAVGISGSIGILAGIVPAKKASRLDPIEALRTE